MTRFRQLICTVLCWPEKGRPDGESSSDSEEELAIPDEVRKMVMADDQDSPSV